MSEVLPAITSDEVETEIDITRDEEIKGEKPPHR